MERIGTYRNFERLQKGRKLKSFGLSALVSVGLLVNNPTADTPLTPSESICEITTDSTLQTQSSYGPIREALDVSPVWKVSRIDRYLADNNFTVIHSEPQLNKLDEASRSGLSFVEQLSALNDFMDQREIEVSYKGTPDSKDYRPYPDDLVTVVDPLIQQRLTRFARQIEPLPKEFFDSSNVHHLSFSDSLRTRLGGTYSQSEGRILLNSNLTKDMFEIFMHEMGHDYGFNLIDSCKDSKEVFTSLNPDWFSYTDEEAEATTSNDTTNSVRSPEEKAFLRRQAVEAGVVVRDYAATSYVEDVACTIEAFINGRGIKIQEFNKASDIQRNKLLVLLDIIGQKAPEVADYILNMTAIGIRGGLESARG